MVPNSTHALCVHINTWPIYNKQISQPIKEEKEIIRSIWHTTRTFQNKCRTEETSDGEVTKSLVKACEEQSIPARDHPRMHSTLLMVRVT